MHQREEEPPPTLPTSQGDDRALRQAHAQQQTKDWNADYALRAGVEGTIRQATAVTGSRRARYRGLAKTHLDHIYSAPP
ncbi:transposase [Streptantibioticus ferralitis]|uniref:Transposase n=1 Tax=Streptantibioticus ferralitis TaxID=236510 RepID=A0ABT5Z4U3_9ACTN|nr:transposase [Streptantibioticus ferralitis]MDF2258798.1 transposase [Streptantibioticus ferralitis]